MKNQAEERRLSKELGNEIQMQYLVTNKLVGIDWKRKETGERDREREKEVRRRRKDKEAKEMKEEEWKI